jgi:hypothetical protein
MLMVSKLLLSSLHASLVMLAFLLLLSSLPASLVMLAFLLLLASLLCWRFCCCFHSAVACVPAVVGGHVVAVILAVSSLLLFVSLLLASLLKEPKCEIFDPFFFTPINPIWVGDLRTGEFFYFFLKTTAVFFAHAEPALKKGLRRLSLR